MVFVSSGFTIDADPQSAAQDVYKRFNAVSGSSEALNQNFLRPLTSSDAVLVTPDGKSSGQVAMSCPISNHFIDLSVAPTLTGDISFTLNHDLNFDGRSDYTLPSNGAVSGVCSNGFISCDPGRWTNCKSFGWEPTASGQVAIVPTSLQLLGGCYCINNSCMPTGSSNRSNILKDLGGGAVGAILSGNPKIAITDAKVENNRIEYVAQSVGACISKTPSPALEQYQKNPLKMSEDGLAVVTSKKDDNTPISFLTQSALSKNNSAELRTCSKEHLVSITSVEHLCSAAHFPNEKQSKETTKYYRILVAGSFHGENGGSCGGVPGAFCSYPVENVQTVYSVPEGSIYMGRSAEGFYGRESHRTIRRHYHHWSYYAYDYYSVCTEIADILSETFVDNCSRLHATPECRVKEVTSDGVKTVRDFSPTRLAPLTSCRAYQGRVSSYQVCDAGWRAEETFLCESKNSFDYTQTITRANGIKDSASLSSDGTSFYYTDQIKNPDGSVSRQSVTTSLPSTGTYSNCERTCKTSKMELSADVATTATRQAVNNDLSTTRFFYKSCVNNSCPIGAGESVVKECQCLNEFPDAIGSMMILDAARKELMCSSGIKR